MSDHLIAEASRHANALPVNPDRMALALALQTIDELERELAALRQDKARLDWLLNDNKDARAAIDAARKEAAP